MTTDIAKIESTFLGFEDHGLLTASVTFDYGDAGGHQAIGHRIFGSVDESRSDNWGRGHEMGMEFIRSVLLACGVSDWAKLPGRTVYVTHDYSNITKLEPLPTEHGTPFDIQVWADAWSAK